MKPIISFFLITSGFQMASAQVVTRPKTWVISLLDSSLNPISGAEIFIESEHIQMTTDPYGISRTPVLSTGFYELEVHTEHHPDWHQLCSFPFETDTVILHTPYNWAQRMSVVELHSTLKSQSISSAWASHQTPQSFAQLMSQQDPSIQLIQTGSGIQKPMAQGLWGTRLPIFQNGIRLESLSWGVDHAPELDAWNFNRITIHRGAQASILAPDGGGLALDTRWDPQPHTWHRDYQQLLSIQSVNGQVLSAGKLNWNRSADWSQAKQAHWSFRRSGDFLSPEGRMSNTGQFEGSLSYFQKTSHSALHLSYYGAKNGLYAGSSIGNLTDFQQAISGQIPTRTGPFTYAISKPFQRVQHGWAHWQVNPKNPFDASVQLDYRQEFDWNRVGDFPQLEIALLSFQQQKQWNKNNKRLGVQLTEQVQSYGGYYFVPDYQSLQAGLFTQIQGRWANVALRFDLLQRRALHPIYESRGYFLPSLGISRNVGNVQLHYNLSSRAPSVVELYSRGVHHGAASFEQGLPSLSVEHIHKIQLISHWGPLQLQSFLMQSPSFIDAFPMPEAVITVRGAFPGFEYQQNAALYAGLSAQLQDWKIKGPWSIQTQAQFVWGKLTQFSRYPSALPCPSGVIELNYSSPHCSAHLSGTGVLQQPFYSENTDYKAPPASYIRMDARIEWENQTGQLWSVYIQNATNAHYREYLDRFRYFLPAPSWNLGFRWQGGFHHHYHH